MPTGFSLATETADRDSRLVLRGSLALAEGERFWHELGALLRAGSSPTVQLDVAGLTRIDGGAAALLAARLAEARARGREVIVVGAAGEAARLLQLYDCTRGGPCERPSPRTPGIFSEVGEFAHTAVQATGAILAFFGDLLVGAVGAMRRPRTVHFGQFGLLLERAGADGAPIVLLINFLVGAVLGLQGAIQLHRFGADPFLANLVGLSVVRELGPLMTAILVIGRSGAAYAAELGTMTVNEEVDALRTLGQDPQRFLVFPRVLTLLITLPLLTMFGDLFGVLGGLTIAVGYLEQPVVTYTQALQAAIGFGDVGTGLLKSVGFALAIVLIACQRGLATRGGADGVGRATTSAVVVSLFSLVVIDAIFTWAFTQLGW